MSENFDSIELEKFHALANDWWDPKGSCRPLHALNPTRMQFIADRIDLKQKKILDIGCGGGILSETLAQRGAEVTAIDMNISLLNIAREHATQNQCNTVTYEQSTAEAYAEQRAHTFDVITCMELLEHVPDPHSLIVACSKLIKPGGSLFFSTVNRTLKSYAFAIIGAEYVLKVLPKNTHQYNKFIRPAELKGALEQTRLTLEELMGMSYNPITHQTKLCRDVSVNYLAYATAQSAS